MLLYHEIIILVYSKWDSIYKHSVLTKLSRNILMAENMAYVGKRKRHGARFTSPSPVGGLMAHWEKPRPKRGSSGALGGLDPR